MFPQRICGRLEAASGRPISNERGVLETTGPDDTTHSASTSTAADLCRRWIDTTNLTRFLRLSSIPSTPRNGPATMCTDWPTCRYGQAYEGRVELTMHRILAISSSVMGLGTPPYPTTRITPGVVITSPLSFPLSLQNTYPGNSGRDSAYAWRPFLFTAMQESGKKSSYPLLRSICAHICSLRVLTCNANH